MISLRISLFLFLLSMPLAHAQSAPTAAPLSEAETKGIKARAETLHKEAKARQQAADKKLSTDKAACYSRFQVNSCLEDEDEAYRLDSEAAHKLGREANTLERDLRARESAEKAAGFAPEAQRKAEAERLRQEQAQQLEDFAKRAGERAERVQAGAAREAEQQKTLQQSVAAQQAQRQRNAEAQQRATAARQSTSAQKTALEQAKQRKQAAQAQEQKLMEKKTEPKPEAAAPVEKRRPDER